MRFQQLKRNPNSILKKRLVKSGKDWLVISSLSIMGGLIFMGSSTTVKADNSSGQSAEVEQKSSIPAVTTDTMDKTNVTQGSTSADIENDTQPDTSKDVDGQTNDSFLRNNSVNETEQPVESKARYQVNSQVDTNTPETETTEEQKVTQSANFPEDNNSSNTAEVQDPPAGMVGNIVESGKDGNSDFFLTDKGILYLMDGELSVEDTQNLGLKYNSVVNTIDTTLSEPGSVYAPENSSYLFSNEGSSNWWALKTLNLSHLNTSRVMDMEHMFDGDRSLESLNVSNFDTSKVTDMGHMFDGAESVKSLDVSNFKTPNVVNMEYMFNYMTSLESLDLSNFDTSKVANMANMFSGLYSVKSLDVSHFNTSKVTDMEYMFETVALESLDVSNFKTPNVVNMESMFAATRIESLDLSSFVTSKVTKMDGMFIGSEKLRDLNLSQFDTTATMSNKHGAVSVFSGVQLSKVTLGKSTKFKDAPSFVVSDDGKVASYWVKLINGKESDQHFGEIELFTSGVAGTFVLGGLHYRTTVFSEEDYINDHLYIKTTSNPIDIHRGGWSKEEIKKMKNPIIPADWNLDTKESALYLSLNGQDSEQLLFNVADANAHNLNEISYAHLPKMFADVYFKYADNAMTLKMYYTGDNPSYTDNPSPKPVPNHTSGSNHNYLPVSSLIQTVSTFSDNPPVQLWSFDRDTSSVAPVTNRQLSPGSNWYSDKMVNVDDVDYLRVATNEWVKSSDVYRYVANPINITVNSKNEKFVTLVDENGKTITDRTLSNGSNWYSDYVGYLNTDAGTLQANDSKDKYYRIATNEFVNANYVTENK